MAKFVKVVFDEREPTTEAFLNVNLIEFAWINGDQKVMVRYRSRGSNTSHWAEVREYPSCVTELEPILDSLLEEGGAAS